MVVIKRRRGRPRHEHSKVDKGTQELQYKRQFLLEKGHIKDSSLAESLLGILYAHQLISQPLYEVGCFFGELGYQYEPCLCHAFRPRASVLMLNKGKSLSERPSPLSDWKDEKQTKTWRMALKALKKAGSRSYKIVLRVVFYDQDLYTTALPSSLLKEVESLRQGLASLEIYFKEGLKDRRDSSPDLVLNPVKPT